MGYDDFLVLCFDGDGVVGEAVDAIVVAEFISF